MKVQDFVIGVVAILALVAVGMVVGLNKDVRDSQKSYSQMVQKAKADSITIVRMNKTLDSMKVADRAMVRSILSLDSINQDKTSKADRAERRGRFIGGLLKGLLPHL